MAGTMKAAFFCGVTPCVDLLFVSAFEYICGFVFRIQDIFPEARDSAALWNVIFRNVPDYTASHSRTH